MAVDVQVLGGDLIVSGTADAAVQIVATGENSFSVTEGESEAQTFEGVRDDIRINLDAGSTATDDDVTLDLGGFTFDRLTVNMGDGNNQFTLQNGTVESLLFRR